MAALVESRGPDDSGEWTDPDAGMALGHRRLAIIDLSPGGRQPMVSAGGDLVIAYNGEIYNFRELRAELESAGATFRGDSDTEVLLEACAAWGVERAIGRCIGMFAFALWDRGARRLHLARDRLGIKPLYWARTPGGDLVFASQPKCFSAHPDWRPAVDRAALAAYLRHGYVNAPQCIYRGAFQVRPGCMLTVDADGEAREHRYWDAVEVARNGAGRRRERPGDEEAVERLDGLLRDAVARRMVADVPLGAFLSGGTDSSTVVALMQSQSSRPIRTFSIGFSEKRFDEAVHARAVARHLGTDHTELYVEPDDALDLVPTIAERYDEPFGDSSQLPTLLVSELARRHVTVALSGDGGDELFAGYNRHARAHTLRRVYARSPAWARRAAAGALTTLRPGTWDRLSTLMPERVRPRLIGDKLHLLAEAVSLERFDDVYPRLVSQWPLDAELVPGEGRGRGGSTPPRSTPALKEIRSGCSSWTSSPTCRGHPRQGRPREHGVLARGARAAPRPPGRRARLEPAARLQAPRRGDEVDPPAGARALFAALALRAAEDGVRGADRPLAEGAAAGLGGRPPRPGLPRRRGPLQCRARPPAVERAPVGRTQLAVPALDGADGAGVAPPLARPAAPSPPERRAVGSVPDRGGANSDAMRAKWPMRRPLRPCDSLSMQPGWGHGHACATEEPKAPDFVLEVASANTWREDEGRMHTLYEHLGVREQRASRRRVRRRPGDRGSGQGRRTRSPHAMRACPCTALIPRRARMAAASGRSRGHQRSPP